MTSKIMTKAGLKLFEKHLEIYTPADPLYESWTDEHGKKHRRTRELPPGLSKRDAEILKSVKKRAHYLDKGFGFCGIRFGWTFIIGFVPGAGDAVDAFLNYFLVVRKARQADLPWWLVRKMLMNNAISAVIGFVPVVGDVLLAVFKANSRNAALLEEFLRIRGEEFIKLHVEGKDVVAATTPHKPDTHGKTKEEAKTEKEKQKAKESEQIASGVTKSDAVQVKPGAGRVSGEVIPVPVPVPGSYPAESSEATSPNKQNSLKNSGTWKRALTWRRQNKTQPGHKGKQVENISSSSGNEAPSGSK